MGMKPFFPSDCIIVGTSRGQSSGMTMINVSMLCERRISRVKFQSGPAAVAQPQLINDIKIVRFDLRRP
jgi:hypothetical protein